MQPRLATTLAFALTATALPAQISFLPLPVTTGTPPASADIALMRDFSGPSSELLAFVSAGASAETWAYANAAWTKLTPVPSPPPRTGFAATDGAIFGGKTAANVYLDDTWMLQISSSLWTKISSSNGNYPPGRADAAFCLGAGVNLLVGGRNQNGVLGDCWELKEITTFPYGWNWIPAPTGPSARYDHAIAVHPLLGVPILFGGRDANGNSLDDTWLFQNGAWTLATPAQKPAARSRHVMTYDVERGCIVLYGGVDATQQPIGDVWEWMGNAWTQRASAGVPIARADAAMSYHDRLRRCAIYGGASQTDLWSYGTDFLPETKSYGGTCVFYEFGAGELVPVAPVVAVLGGTLAANATLLRPTSSALFLFGTSRTVWGPFTLPLNVDAWIGGSGCLLLTSIDATVSVTATGGFAPLSVPVPVDLSLAGATLHVQTLGELLTYQSQYKLGLTNALEVRIGVH